MNDSTSIEVKCDCKIPFHSELVAHLKRMFVKQGRKTESDNLILNQEEIADALKSKTVFIRVAFPEPVKKISPFVMKSIKNMLRKDIVGVIRVGNDEITLVLL
ncbi:hypothetical protein [Flavobacterium selenitireducens]|uniref:hypothetical protein n=1 Tax=Flavobacterium selenitireducens TaxID=2722704 RepID=UPI00168B1167|nr:hypothetical protein [Flavobacterium selenitireducens]MBD3581261.1 hypothetical protein [Flavobacterium selenitireducens]